MCFPRSGGGWYKLTFSLFSVGVNGAEIPAKCRTITGKPLIPLVTDEIGDEYRLISHEAWPNYFKCPFADPFALTKG